MGLSGGPDPLQLYRQEMDTLINDPEYARNKIKSDSNRSFKRLFIFILFTFVLISFIPITDNNNILLMVVPFVLLVIIFFIFSKIYDSIITNIYLYKLRKENPNNDQENTDSDIIRAQEIISKNEWKKICVYCGTKIFADKAFCPSCGAELNSDKI